MKVIELGRINKFYFGYEELAKVLGINPASARVAANRYASLGFLVRMKRNVYVLRERWKAARREEKFLLANLAQVPSYISFMTALDYYEVTTQVQRDFFESAAVKRTKEINVDHTIFRYTKVKSELYFGFEKRNGFFIATPEKALLDAFYLKSYGRYDFDLSSINPARFEMGRLKQMSGKFPKRTREMMERNGYFRKA